MSGTQSKKITRGLDIEVSKWLNKKEQNNIHHKSTNEADKSVTLTYNDKTFTIKCPRNYPDNTMGSFYVEYDSTDPSLLWVGYVNLFCTQRNPDNLYKVLKQIDESVKKHSCDKVKYSFIENSSLDDRDEVINSFDIDISRLKSKLTKNLANCRSCFISDQAERKGPVMFQGDGPGNMILNEFIEIYKKYKADDRISVNVVDDNIYHWKVKCSNFESKRLTSALDSIKEKYGYNYLEFDIHLDDKYYPSFHPIVKYVRPRLNKCLMHRLSNLDMIKSDYWTPARGLDFVIRKLYEILGKHADVNINSHMNDMDKYPMGAYLELEDYLMKLASYCENVNDFDQLDEQKYEKINPTTKTKEKNKNDNEKPAKTAYWASGTGYGTSGSKEWNINEYVTMEKQKEKQVITLLTKIMEKIQNHDVSDIASVYNTIDGSYLISYIKSTLKGASFLDMTKHIELYTQIFAIVQNLVTEHGCFLLVGKNDKEGIIDILADLNNKGSMITNLIKDDNDNNMPAMIEGLYVMAKQCCDIYAEDIKKNIVKPSDEAKTENDVYIENMKKYRYSSYDILSSSFSKELEGTLSSAANKSVVKRIASEYTTMMDSLPIHMNATIMLTADKNNIRACRAAITGPDGTPYDSAMYIFDIVFPATYPVDPPLVKIRNNGGQRLNPNLYNEGKVCLSLLGTWSGSGGEKWNKDTSSLLQVLNSIQSLILIPDPYYNEPGHERNRGTPGGNKMVVEYNNNIRLYSMNHGMCDIIEKPSLYGGFEDAIITHFKLRRDYILQTTGKWVDEAPANMKNAYTVAYERLKKCLKAL